MASTSWFLWISTAWETARVKYFGGVPTNRPVRQFSRTEFNKGMIISTKHIRAMRERAEKLGSRFGVVWLPADVYAYPRTPPRDIPLRAELQRRIQNSGIPSIDLLSVVNAQPDPTLLYIEGDGHFSVEGNAMAGREVARWIQSRELLPRR